jgi:hypothetical protein
MAIVKGQWYQWKIYPNQFYRVSAISSAIQLYPFDTTKYQVIYVPAAYLQANFRLLATSPQYFLIDAEVSGTSHLTRSFVVKDKVVSGSVSGQSSVSHSHALLDTTLRAKIRRILLVTKARLYLSAVQMSGNVQAESFVIGNFTPAPSTSGHVSAVAHIMGSDFTVYPLEGEVNASGRIVQAHAD